MTNTLAYYNGELITSVRWFITVVGESISLTDFWVNLAPGTVVEHSTHYPKIPGSNPTTETMIKNGKKEKGRTNSYVGKLEERLGVTVEGVFVSG